MKRKLNDMSRALETYLDGRIQSTYASAESRKEYESLSSKEKLKIRKEMEQTSLDIYVKKAQK
jgi:hypothetical protein